MNLIISTASRLERTSGILDVTHETHVNVLMSEKSCLVSSLNGIIKREVILQQMQGTRE